MYSLLYEKLMRQMPVNKDNKYAPESPIYINPHKFNNNIKDKTIMKFNKKSVFVFILQSKLKNITKQINKKYFIKSPFKPSIKFPPFINTIKQKETKITFARLLDKIKSKNSILVLFISKPIIFAKNMTNAICKINLKLTLFNLFTSDIKPIKKIQIRNNNNEKF